MNKILQNAINRSAKTGETSVLRADAYEGFEDEIYLACTDFIEDSTNAVRYSGKTEAGAPWSIRVHETF